MKRHLNKVIVALFLGFLFFSTQVKAQEVETSYKFEFILKENEPSIGRMILAIDNQEDNKVVDFYEVTIPIQYADSFAVKLGDNEENNFVISDQNGYKKISISFEKPVLPKESKALVIQFSSPKLLVSQFGLKQLYIQNPFDNLSKSIFYEIEYPKSFGEIFRTFDSEQISSKDELTNLLSIESNSGIYVVWGQDIRVNLKGSVNVRNENTTQNSLFFSLPSSSTKQKVFFKNLENIDKAFSDLEENVLGEATIEPKSAKQVGYEAEVVIDGKPIESQYPKSYGFKFSESSIFGQEVLSQTQNISDNYEKIKLFNQLLMERVSTNKQATINYSNTSDLWSKLENNSTLNSFEFAALNVAFAEYLGLDARIEYGYLLLSPVDFDLSAPQMWAVVRINDKDVFIDSFMQDLTNISYFDINYIDRVKFGVWHPLQSYNPALGLAYESNSIKVESSKSETSTHNTDVKVDFVYPETASAGAFFSAKVSVVNNSDQILSIKKVVINDEDLTSLLADQEGLIESVLPGESKDLVINNFREANIFATYSQEVKSQAFFEGIEQGFSDSDNIIYHIDPKNVVVFISVVGLSFSLLGFLYLRARKRNTK